MEGRLRRSWDVDVEVSASTSGRELGRHLRAHVADCGVPADESWRWWLADGRPLHEVASVPAEVPRGTTVTFGPTRPERPLRLEIEAPDVGVRAELAVGIHSIGGAGDDDVQVAGLPPRAGVLEVRESGAVVLRRHESVVGDDEDGIFGSPTTGRSRRVDPAGDASTGGEFGLDGIRFVLRRCSVPIDSTAPHPVNRTPYRPVREGPRRLPDLPAPPPSPRANRMAITTFVVPLATGVGMAFLLGRPEFLLITLLAPLALGGVHLVQRRRGARTFAAQRCAYRDAIAAAVLDISAEATRAFADAHAASPAVGLCVRTALERDSRLWQRSASGPHLLRLRVGVAPRPPDVHVAVAAGGDPTLRAEAESAARQACVPPGPVPITVDVDDAVAVAVCGATDVAYGVVRSLLAQAVTHHGPEDVVVVAALSPAGVGRVRGLGLLPHVGADSGPSVATPIAVWGDDVDRLLSTLADAGARAEGGHAHQPRTPRVLLVVDDRAPIDRGTLERVFDSPSSGVRVLWVGEDPALVPRQCRSVVIVDDDGTATLTVVDPDVDPQRCHVDVLDVETFDAVARSLAPCVDAASPSRSGALSGHVCLDDVVGVTTPEAIATRWAASDGASLTAPIGESGRGAFAVDLVADGPHALVAGTTGSGKSELLQTWVASMAALHPPERCTFLFVDYKGGATAAALEALPHVVGSVTNLDPRLAQRSLVSLRAELTRRMELMADRAKDIADFAAVDPARCPPRLVIVIDEFATLVKEVPDFLAGVVDVAQRGRSLGIHLVLATQRPSGAVNDDILANAPLRMALRVVDGMDSRSIIGTDDAATLAPGLAGRCFVRRGPGGLAGVQIARATAPVRRDVDPNPVVRAAISSAADPDEVDEADTQLDSVVRAVCEAHARTGRPSPHRPWVPELPDVVGLDAVAADVSDDPGRRVVVGLADEPQRQRRVPAVVDLEVTGGLAVFGGGGSGRTTALRTACASALAAGGPDAVQVVVFDFASRALLAFDQVPHTRALVTGDDLDGVCREIEHLSAEVDRRRALLATWGAGEWGRVPPDVRPPRLLLVLDGLGAARSALDSATGHPWWDQLVHVLIDGRGVGIHGIVSADRRNDLPAALLGGLGARFVLRMNEPEAMVVLGAPRSGVRGSDLGVGRGFLDGREVQVAVLDSTQGVTASSESSELVRMVGAHPPAVRSRGLPDVLAAAALDAADTLSAIPVGLDERGETVTIDVTGPVAVVGPHGSGRSELLGLVAEGARTCHGAVRDVLVVAAAQPEPVGWPPGVVPVSSAAAVEDARRRGAGRTLLIVDDAERLSDAATAAAVDSWIEDRLPVVVAVERGALGRSLTGLVGRVRRVRPLVVLAPDSAADVEAVVGRRIRFRPGAGFPPGRALVVSGRETTLTQIAHRSGTTVDNHENT